MIPLSKSIYLSLGSNVGDSALIISTAIAAISARYELTGASRLYRTSPQDVTDQPDFLNCAIRIQLDTALTSDDLLSFLQEIEAVHGRDRQNEISKGPRSLDIDIIFYADQVRDDVELTIPHPSYSNRRFVLAPLLDIDPTLADPRDNTRLRDMEKALQTDESQGIYLSESGDYNIVISSLRTSL